MNTANLIFRGFLVVFGCFLLVALIISVTTLLRGRPHLTHLQQVKASGQLRILTRYGQTTYYTHRDQAAGVEYELTQRFAQWLGVQPVYVIPERFSELLAKILAGEADLAAAGLVITDARRQYLRFAPPYQQIVEQLVYRDSQARPKSLNDLNREFLEVVANSSHVRTLKRWQQKFPNLTWTANARSSSEKLLHLVDQGLIDYTVVNSNQLAAIRRFYPRLKAAFDLTESRALAWAFSKRHDGSLQLAAVEFFAELQQDGALDQILERYYGHIDAMNYADVCTFRKHYKQRLPRYRKYFQEAGQRYGIDWRLLAAIAYQESHWNEQAVSPTGVRGLMMLTQNTARQIQVKDRLDPRSSILGGTGYLFALKDKIPDRIAEPDRTWFALAAYNIGFGHLEDARILTQTQGGDPDKWLDVKRHLPLLSSRKWYRLTKHGYARGQEPVDYIENVRNYYDLLVWLTEKSSVLSRQAQPLGQPGGKPKTQPAKLRTPPAL